MAHSAVEKTLCPLRHARFGGVAQLGERLPCTQEAIGSNPFTSTTIMIVGGGKTELGELLSISEGPFGSGL